MRINRFNGNISSVCCRWGKIFACVHFIFLPISDPVIIRRHLNVVKFIIKSINVLISVNTFRRMLSLSIVRLRGNRIYLPRLASYKVCPTIVNNSRNLLRLVPVRGLYATQFQVLHDKASAFKRCIWITRWTLTRPALCIVSRDRARLKSYKDKLQIKIERKGLASLVRVYFRYRGGGGRTAVNATKKVLDSNSIATRYNPYNSVPARDNVIG